MPAPAALQISASMLFVLLSSLLGRFLGRLLANSLDALRLSTLRPLCLRLPLALELPLPPPPPVPKPLLPGSKPLRPQSRRLGQPSDAPVVLAVAVVGPQLQDPVRLPGLDASHLKGDPRGRQGGLLGRRADGKGRHVEAALALSVLRVRQRVSLVEDNANVFAVRVQRRVAVVLDVARGHGVDGVVAAHDAVLARPPVRASLFVDDVARDDILVCTS